MPKKHVLGHLGNNYQGMQTYLTNFQAAFTVSWLMGIVALHLHALRAVTNIYSSIKDPDEGTEGPGPVLRAPQLLQRKGLIFTKGEKYVRRSKILNRERPSGQARRHFGQEALYRDGGEIKNTASLTL